MNIIKRIVKAGENISVFILVAITILCFISIILRYFFNFAFVWSEEIQRFGLIALIFFALGQCAFDNKHISTEVLPAAIRKKLAPITLPIIYITCATVAFGAIKVVQNSYFIGQVGPASRLPMWIMYATVLVGYLLAGIGSTKALYDFIKKKPDTEQIPSNNIGEGE